MSTDPRKHALAIAQAAVVITLECGHKKKMRSAPMSDRSRFPCPISAQVCGYNLKWVEWTDGGNHGYNRLVQQDNAITE